MADSPDGSAVQDGGSRQIAGDHMRSGKPGSGKSAGTVSEGTGDEGFTGKRAHSEYGSEAGVDTGSTAGDE